MPEARKAYRRLTSRTRSKNTFLDSNHLKFFSEGYKFCYNLMYVYLLLDGCVQLNLMTTISKALEGLRFGNKHFYLNRKI